MKTTICVQGTGGGMVFNAIKSEFNHPTTPRHTFGFDLAASGGGWMDAPEYYPAGSMLAAGPEHAEYIFASSACRS